MIEIIDGIVEKISQKQELIILADWADNAPDELNIEKAVRFAGLVTDFERALGAGITYNGSIFQSGAASITALNEVLTAIANGWGIPANFAWIDSSDVPHVADLTFLKGLAIALADHKAALFARLQVAKAALRSATTQAEIEAITL